MSAERGFLDQLGDELETQKATTEERRQAERLAAAWDDGWNAHHNYAAQVATWRASQGETGVAQPLNPYRVRS